MMHVEEDHTDKDDNDYMLGEDINHDNMSYTGMPSQADESNREDDAKKSTASSLGFSKTEQDIVTCSRCTFLFCLLLSAVGLAAAIYCTGRRDEMEDFEDEVRTG